MVSNIFPNSSYVYPMILNQHTVALRAQCEDLVKDLQQLSQEIGHKELAVMVGELRNRMSEPFMFVIVGEVKAGKSSFVNALLESKREICAVAPQPMTDTVQQILYGDKEETVTVNPFLKKIYIFWNMKNKKIRSIRSLFFYSSIA